MDDERLLAMQTIVRACGGETFAEQHGKIYKPTKPARKLEAADLAAHVDGKRVLACYLMAPGSTVTQIAGLDFDDHKGTVGWRNVVATAKKVVAALATSQQYPFAVRSRGGAGIHLWLVWTEALSAADVRTYLLGVLASCGLSEGSRGLDYTEVEIFPKTVSVRKNGVGFHLTLPFAGQGAPLDPETLEVVGAVPPVVVNGPGPVRGAAGKDEAPDRDEGGGAQFDFEPDIIRDALKFIKPDDRNTRIRIGLAIKTSAADVGSPAKAAFELWQEWVVGSGDEFVKRKCEKAWQQFKVLPAGERGRITLGSLYYMARAAGWEGQPGEGPGRIIVRGSHLNRIIDKVHRTLIVEGVTIYQRGGELVRPVHLAKRHAHADGVKRAPGATILHTVTERWLVQKMADVLEWYEPTAKGLKPIDPPQRYAAHLLARVGQWEFPVLRGVINAPTLMFDGRLVEEPGYHAESKLLLDFGKGEFAPVSKAPTQEDALKSIERFKRPLRSFPFVSQLAESVAVSALLTALIRPAMRTSPLHGFDAPVAGTGKSLLAETVGLLATGNKPAALSQGKTSEEDEKRLSTVLHAGDQIIMLDNCEHQLQGDFLCSMLTQELVQARILGLSERRLMPCNALVLANGNNLTFAGDVSRRAVVCRMDAGTERPDELSFDFDVHEEVKRDRAELVVAGLTVLRAYRLAGSPLEKQLKPMGSFDDWSWIRGALVWLGYPDPAESRKVIFEGDPRKAELAEVMKAWGKAYGDKKISLADIGRVNGADDARAELRKLLSDVACRNGLWNTRSVGWWMRKNAGKPVAGRVFVKTDGVGQGLIWRLKRADSGAAQQAESQDC